MATGFTVRFWGVRGSIPVPGAATVRYGGNTPCVEVQAGGQRLIFDGGTGLRVLGQTLKHQTNLEAHLFFSHSHWDHIQGFPFFTPAYQAGNRLHIYGPAAHQGYSIKQSLSNQMLDPNFPVPLQVMQADLSFHDLLAGDVVTIGDVTVETGSLNHPNYALGYRVTWRGKTVVYASDTEHYPDRLDRSVVHLARQADVLIYDANYTDEEYNDPVNPRRGWGHSTWQAGVQVAKAAGVRQLVLFHHDANHDDDFLDQVEAQVRQIMPSSVLAREGMVLQLL
ncbi:MAG: MBL fold metallo-hydrolase [Gloeomargarita sp. SKYBB_i_bin120]|nr:MBL fold metallo-hydrolase [Gloeomargarita sp. SKYG98]MCS7293648.1 MBL fold metallo-hydrolase [Gloeomargarita sp. SKYB120]MDW8179214.1 MBL fold metallo-hydrolase [Gloeomargarita sp. SKYBB_i_bin120]